METQAICIRAGRTVSEEGDSSTHWAVFTRESAEEAFGAPIDAENAHEAAVELTGWTRFYGGPGRAFGESACVRLYNHAILVYQHTGLDI
jgi:hypothetical protein